MRYAKTEWGIKVKIFTQRYGITLKEMAAVAGVNYPSLLQVMVGKTPGEKLIPKMDAFMESHAAKTVAPKIALRTFENSDGAIPAGPKEVM